MIIPEPSLTPINVPSTWKPQRYKLAEDWVIIHQGTKLFFPRGFEADLASVPRPFWVIPGFDPMSLRHGSIPHDFGYQYGYLLGVYNPDQHYPEASMVLREQFPILFSEHIPLFVGWPQEFYDSLLEGLTVEATGRVVIAKLAALALKCFGSIAWNRYRSEGPGAFNTNSLSLPGCTSRGMQF